MQAVSLALLYLGSVSFFGLEAAKLDLASDFKRKWNKWVRRDLSFAAEPDAALRLLPTPGAQDEPGVAQAEPRSTGSGVVGVPSEAGPAHLRARRHSRPGTPSLAHLNVVRLGCRLGTCNTHNLAHMIFHLTDKDKDSSAPAGKISEMGYGRRRRRRGLGASSLRALSARSLGRGPSQ